MTKRKLSSVHGHTIPTLETLLQESCDLFDGPVKLDGEVVGGWSNINIRGQSSDISFILKLPWMVNPDPSHYDYLYRVSEYFGKLGVTASPLSKGNLYDKKETPFLILEYLVGVTHESISVLSDEEANQFSKCLKLFHKHKPPELRSYYSPLDYILTHQDKVESHSGLSSCREDLDTLIQSFNETLDMLLEYAEILGSWPMTVMHGDLWIPNVIFQAGKAILLDLEDCSLGDNHYDIAQLLESLEQTIQLPPALLEGYNTNRIEELQPIARGWSILWSLERLLSMDTGIVEASLNLMESRNAVMDYTRNKIADLEKMFI